MDSYDLFLQWESRKINRNTIQLLIMLTVLYTATAFFFNWSMPHVTEEKKDFKNMIYEKVNWYVYYVKTFS